MVMSGVGGVGPSNLAIHVIGAAAFYLNLDRGVIDLEFLVEFCHDGAEDLLAGGDGLFVDEDMAAGGDDAGADGPDVEVVDVEDAVDGGDGFFNFGHVDVGGGGFEEDVEA